MALPAVAAPRDEGRDAPELTHFSQVVAFRQWLAHPDQAPEKLAPTMRKLRSLRKSGTVSGRVARAFNGDTLGLPQNEESIASCRSRPSVVLGSTNDYRGLLDAEGNFTGWHLSLDGGASLAREGLLPSIGGIPSGGDPVSLADAACNLYGGSLNYDPADPEGNPNGVGVYRSTPAILAACPGGSSAACWPTRKLVATSAPSHFLDKEWVDVGVSGSAGNVVWATYTDFTIDPSAPLGFSSARINAVRCTADLLTCTPPILVSGPDVDTQFSDVTIAPDGRVYVSWTEVRGELTGEPQTFVHKLRVAPAGSTTFGPTRVVSTELNPIPMGGVLHANSFRVSTYPKNEVVRLGASRQRVFVTWDACRARPLDVICEEPAIKLAYSDNDGATWSAPKVVSAGGDNYFPTITGDRATGRLALAWYTNRHDRIFHNRQDVEMISVDPATVAVKARTRLTSPSNETEADPLLGAAFIGDYIEAFADNHRVLVHYNANYRSVKLLDGLISAGFPVPQQDNFLARGSD